MQHQKERLVKSTRGNMFGNTLVNTFYVSFKPCGEHNFIWTKMIGVIVWFQNLINDYKTRQKVGINVISQVAHLASRMLDKTAPTYTGIQLQCI